MELWRNDNWDELAITPAVQKFVLRWQPAKLAGKSLSECLEEVR